MPDLIDMELCCLEARGLIARAEVAVHTLNANGACEGHLLMAAQGLAAMRHLNRIIELHHNRLVGEAHPTVVSPPVVPRRTWLTVLRQRLAIGGPALETQV